MMQSNLHCVVFTLHAAYMTDLSGIRLKAENSGHSLWLELKDVSSQQWRWGGRFQNYPGNNGSRTCNWLIRDGGHTIGRGIKATPGSCLRKVMG
jgi:hypothetical protein